jgi:hypothetical protein
MEYDSKSEKVYRWRWVRGILVEVFAKGAIDHAAWDRFIAELAQKRADTRGVLVLTTGAGPSPSQRAALRKVIGEGASVPAAILENSRLSRGITSALNLLLPPEARPRVFSPDQLDEALAYLQVPSPSRPEVRNAMVELQRELGMAVQVGQDTSQVSRTGSSD